MSANLNIRKAAFINGIGKYLKILLTLVVNAILARLLSPSDFGITAVVTVFTTFFSYFSDMGLGPAIIQKKNLDDRDMNSIYTFSVYISILLTICFFGLAYLIADFYNNSVYIGLSQLLSVSLLFNALNMVPNGLLNREKKFATIAIRTVVVYFFASVITIFLAIKGFKYYSLAIQAILTSVFTYIWNIRSVKVKFVFKVRYSSIKKILSFSSYQLAFNVVNYFSRNLDNLLTGKFMGSSELGYYDKAYTLMLYPVNNLTGVVSPVLLPILADFQDDKKLIYVKYMKVVKMLSCIGVLVAPLCFFAAPEIVGILYGSGWNSTIKCFQIFSIAIIPQMINASAGAVYQALDKTKLLFLNSCINTGITVISILIGIFIGGNIVSLSWCVAISYVVQFLSAFYMLIVYAFELDFLMFVKYLLPEFILLLIIAISTSFYFFQISNIFLSFALKFLYIFIIYLIVMFFSKEYKFFIN
ncbi:lipopolysaccharide biosynthesis protein [Liquorilactobacillus nagelii]|uniref:lipopolysaccharide biosynthesis protein n=1 Tax=Liquorilactobacillus nagelii TaxID=82688 RepID=UPI0039EC55DF